MIESVGDLWDFHNKGEWIVITTNGTIKRNGEAVMGRGCALECKQRFPDIPRHLGELLQEFGNIPFDLIHYHIITLPVKHNWWEKADLALIESGLKELYHHINDLECTPHGNNKLTIYMPRPGCGNGKLDWNSQIKPLCEKYLDDRFVVLTK